MESAKAEDPKPIKKSFSKKPVKILGTARAARENTILKPDSPTPGK